jgi:hypothetical protein
MPLIDIPPLEVSGAFALVYVFYSALAYKIFTMVYFGWFLIFLLVGFINWIYAAYYYTYVKPEPNYTVVPTVLGIIILSSLWSMAFMTEFTALFRTTHTLTREGIVKQRWSSRTLMKWSDMEQIRFKGGELFSFRAPEMKINLSLDQQGRKIVAQAIKDYLPVDTWRQAEKAIASILAR